ncbi:MAG TPA: hypothetical protein VGJ84_11910, partial [Polyangiaceae bacterium]
MTLLMCGVSACGVEPGSASAGSTPEHPGVIKQAFSSGEGTVASQPNVNLAESSAVAFQNQSGQWELVAGTMSNYGCTRGWAGGWPGWCNLTTPVSAADPSFVYRAGPTRYLYAASLYGNYIRVERTTEPCPSGCGTPVWQPFCDFGWFYSPDYPTALWKSDEIWIVYVDNGHPSIMKLKEPFCAGGGACPGAGCEYYPDPTVTAGAGAPRAAFDSMGRIHMVFDFYAQSICHQTFDTVTHAWSAAHTVGPVILPLGRCPACFGSNGEATLTGAGSNCLKTRSMPDIAVDPTALPNNTLVITYNSSSSSWPYEMEQR